MQREKVLVAMSGGVDSTAACLKLMEQGYDVLGWTMRAWDPNAPDGRAADEPPYVADARALAARLGIAHEVADVRDAFRSSVVRYFLDSYAAGLTPNPCVVCNRDFKFRLLVEAADRLGCSRIATGHYVRTERRDGLTYLLTGRDVHKDQSYFLWRVSQEVIARSLFPLGDMVKADVRHYLGDSGYPLAASQSESMEACFVEGDYRDFLRRESPDAVAAAAGGDFVDKQGRCLGQHGGVPFYTIGQRKGLGVALGRPVYVLSLDAARRRVVLGDDADLLVTSFLVRDVQAPRPDELLSTPSLSVRIRHCSQSVACRVGAADGGRLRVVTELPVRAVAPGQSAVFYDGCRLVGGAVIV